MKRYTLTTASLESQRPLVVILLSIRSLVYGNWETAALLVIALNIPASGMCQDWIERDILRTDNSRPNHNFGWDVGISGNIAIIGATHDNRDRGAAYLFDVTTGQELSRLTASDGATEDFFGWDVAMSGDTAIVGAFENSENGTHSGAAYLFDVGSGEELFKLSPSDPMAFAEFGADLDIHGDMAIVGAQNYFLDSPGAAYVFDVNSGEELFRLTASDGHDDDLFGREVSISGDTAVVSGRLESGVYVFNLATGAESSNIDIGILDGTITDIDLDGDLVVVGAYENDESQYGSAYVFDISSGELIHELAPPVTTENERFGDRVAVSGNTAIIGNDLRRSSGTAYVFDLTTGDLTQELRGSVIVENDRFGQAVAIDGDSIIVGAYLDEDRRLPGRAYFYVPETLPGDFDNDSLITASDIDLLSEVFRLGSSNSFFDLNGDGELNATDREIWVQDVAGTFAGDADLDKSVDFDDFLVLSTHFGQLGGWADGDFDGTGDIAFPDFLLLSENFGESGVAVTTVPEPKLSSLLVGLGLLTLIRSRTRR